MIIKEVRTICRSGNALGLWFTINKFHWGDKVEVELKISKLNIEGKGVT